MTRAAMDLSLLPSFAHYSLMSSSSVNYGQSYPSSTSSSEEFGHNAPPTSSYPVYPHTHSDSYLAQSSLFKESTPDPNTEANPPGNNPYYYLDSSINCTRFDRLYHHPEWSVPCGLDIDAKPASFTTLTASCMPIATPPLTPRSPECKATFYSPPSKQVNKSAESEEHVLETLGNLNKPVLTPGSKITNEDENYITITNSSGVVRVVKRRSANKKERRRTQSINSAFSNLRDCIPNVPSDTKLSKIKTLRLATSYISYLMELLEGPCENSHKLLSEGFRADLSNSKRSSQQNRLETQHEIERHLKLQSHKQSTRRHMSPAGNENRLRKGCARSLSHKSAQLDLSVEMCPESSEIVPSPLTGPAFQSTCGYSGPSSSKSKCRTGWPQHVWALELKHYDQ